MSTMDENIDKRARELAFTLQNLMAEVDYEHNRHEKCIACGKKFKHHYPDGLPCVSDDEIKPYYKRDRWGNLTIKNP